MQLFLHRLSPTLLHNYPRQLRCHHSSSEPFTSVQGYRYIALSTTQLHDHLVWPVSYLSKVCYPCFQVVSDDGVDDVLGRLACTSPSPQNHAAQHIWFHAMQIHSHQTQEYHLQRRPPRRMYQVAVVYTFQYERVHFLTSTQHLECTSQFTRWYILAIFPPSTQQGQKTLVLCSVNIIPRNVARLSCFKTESTCLRVYVHTGVCVRHLDIDTSRTRKQNESFDTPLRM